MRMTVGLASLCLLTSLTTAAGIANAGITPPDPPAHTIDPTLAATDTAPPSAPVITAVTLEQYDDPPSNARCTLSSTLTIELAPMTDDHSAADKLGYEISLVSGTLPKGLSLPTGPVRPSEFGSYNPPRLTWAFGRSNQTVTFALAVTAVDEAGNRSVRSAPVEETGTATGCSVGGVGNGGRAASTSGGTALLLVVALAFARRRGSRSRTAALASALLLACVALPAHATVYVPPPEAHAIDTTKQATDTTAPSAPVITELTLAQAHGGGNGVSCGPSSSLTIVLASETDNASAADKLGYEIELVAGKLPTGITLPTGPVRANQSSNPPKLLWVFGESNEDVTFSLRVTAVDEAGNRSSASAAVEETGHATGCSVGGSGGNNTASGGATLLLFVAALAIARRQKLARVRARTRLSRI